MERATLQSERWVMFVAEAHLHAPIVDAHDVDGKSLCHDETAWMPTTRAARSRAPYGDGQLAENLHSA